MSEKNNQNLEESSDKNQTQNFDIHNLPLKLLNVVIISGLVNVKPIRNNITLKNGVTISKIEFTLLFCGRNGKNNSVDSSITVQLLGDNACNEIENIFNNNKKSTQNLTIIGTLNPLYGPSLSQDTSISPNKFLITANKINIESYSINGESFAFNDSNEMPWGL